MCFQPLRRASRLWRLQNNLLTADTYTQPNMRAATVVVSSASASLSLIDGVGDGWRGARREPTKRRRVRTQKGLDRQALLAPFETRAACR